MNYRDIIARNLTSREHSIGKIRIDTYYHNQRIVEVDLRVQIGHSFTRINLTYPNLFNEKMFLRKVTLSCGKISYTVNRDIKCMRNSHLTYMIFFMYAIFIKTWGR